MLDDTTGRSATPAKMFSFSRPEMERRWSLVRDHLREQNLDALVVHGYEDKIGGNVKWLTDTPAGYPRTVIFHADDLMTVIENGANGARRTADGSGLDLPGVGEIISHWAFQTAFYTAHLGAEIAVDVLRKRDYRRIGVAGAALIPHGFVSTLRDGLAGWSEIVDQTEFVDRSKARKSPEELTQIRATAATQDTVFTALLGVIRPGMRDFEVNAYVDYQLQLLGAERGTYIAKSAPLGSPAPFGYRHFQGRTIGAGDHITVLLESNGLGALWTEIARTICFGRATAELLDGFALCVEAQAFTAARCVPGALPSDIARAHDAFMIARGGVAESRLYGHGMGYDMVERPLIREDETMALHEGCNLAIHPTHPTRSMLTHICDNYVIGLDGAGAFIHATPKQIFEL